MFGLLRKKHPIVHAHWYALLPNFRSAPGTLYARIIENLEKLEIPAMKTKQMNLTEGGLVTSKRVYLRMERERLVFDVCSAPFGTSWFFSCRICEIPFVFRLWEILLMITILIVLIALFVAVFDLIGGTFLIIGLLVSLPLIARRMACKNNKEFDTVIQRIPAFGTLYEMFVRRNNTYYREDTQLMYSMTVNSVVRSSVETLAKERGVDVVEFIENKSPISPRPFHEKILEQITQVASQVQGISK